MIKVTKIFPETQVDEIENKHEILIRVGTLVNGKEFSHQYNLPIYYKQKKEDIIIKLKKDVHSAIFNMDELLK